MLEAVHLMVDRKQGQGTGYFITGLVPDPLTLDSTSYYIMPSNMAPSRNQPRPAV